MICKKCQQTIDDNSKFCVYCGTRFDENQPVPETQNNVRTCGSCGQQSDMNSRFCIHCGKPFDDSAQNNEQKKNTRVCQSCGKEIYGDSVLCDECQAKYEQPPYAQGQNPQASADQNQQQFQTGQTAQIPIDNYQQQLSPDQTSQIPVNGYQQQSPADQTSQIPINGYQQQLSPDQTSQIPINNGYQQQPFAPDGTPPFPPYGYPPQGPDNSSYISGAEPKKKKTVLVVLIIICCVLGAAAIAVGSFFLYKYMNKNNSDTKNADNSSDTSISESADKDDDDPENDENDSGSDSSSVAPTEPKVVLTEEQKNQQISISFIGKTIKELKSIYGSPDKIDYSSMEYTTEGKYITYIYGDIAFGISTSYTNIKDRDIPVSEWIDMFNVEDAVISAVSYKGSAYVNENIACGMPYSDLKNDINFKAEPAKNSGGNAPGDLSATGTLKSDPNVELIVGTGSDKVVKEIWAHNYNVRKTENSRQEKIYEEYSKNTVQPILSTNEETFTTYDDGGSVTAYVQQKGKQFSIRITDTADIRMVNIYIGSGTFDNYGYWNGDLTLITKDSAGKNAVYVTKSASRYELQLQTSNGNTLQWGNIMLKESSKGYTGVEATVKIKEGYLNVRSSPDSSSKTNMVGKLFKDDIVTIIDPDAESNWAYILHNGVMGYSSKDYLTIKK